VTGTRRTHAIALFSGGLDSCLAVLLMLRQDIEVTALTFMTHFGCDLQDRSSCSHNPYPAAEKFGFTVKLMQLGQDFVDLVRNPKYGHGKNMNPCVDCRILMLRRAKEYLEDVGADVVITGEVLGQRPFSQMRDKMFLTMREAGLRGRLLRPLSARLLEPTIPELTGLIDREQLEGISGRTRHRQLALAKEFGLEDFPSPAGGCLLTEPDFSRKLRDLFTHQAAVTFSDLNLLRVGRHFRFSPRTRIIVGRNQPDNEKLLGNIRPGDLVCEVKGVGSPITLVRGEISAEARTMACAMTARYSDRKNDPEVVVAWTQNGQTGTLPIAPANAARLEPLRV